MEIEAPTTVLFIAMDAGDALGSSTDCSPFSSSTVRRSGSVAKILTELGGGGVRG